MSEADFSQASTACASCLRRSRLVAGLGATLDYSAHDHERLGALLALTDDALIDALGGRRREQLRADHARPWPNAQATDGGDAVVCAHARGYPPALAACEMPPALYVRGGLERLTGAVGQPVVALLGSESGSDYGLEVARGLARALSSSGLTVASVLGDGVAVAALEGAIAGAGMPLALVGASIGERVPPRRRALSHDLARSGCLLSEIPPGSRGRRWGIRAAVRILVGLADLVLVIEAEDTTRELAPARIAEALGRPLGAIPGRITSPLSAGVHALLHEGASLVRGPQDVLELLAAAGRSGEASIEHQHHSAGALDSRLRRVLALVAGGRDTAARLCAAAPCGDHEMLAALGELELRGFLSRGDGGRYVTRVPWEPAG